MKKLSILLAAAAVALGFSACSDDNDPQYKVPAKYVLDTPALQDEEVRLTEDGALDLVSTQPDYGYQAVANYSAEMSLTEDFAESYELSAINGTSKKAAFQVSQGAVATGLCKLLKVDDMDAFEAKYPNGMTPEKVYFRAKCRIPGVEGSEITSNPVFFNKIIGYASFPQPGFIYMIGAPGDWTAPNPGSAASLKKWRLFEPASAVGSKIYSGVFDVPAGKAMFRFYTELTVDDNSGWNGPSFGAGAGNVDFPEFTGGDQTFSNALVSGTGNFNFPNWQGGKMTIIVDMSEEDNYTMTILAGEHPVPEPTYVYLLGDFTGWNAPEIANAASFEKSRLVCKDGSGIYRGTFAVTAGAKNFRFALTLSDGNGWGNPDQIGPDASQNIETPLTNGHYAGPYMNGQGNWNVTFPSDGKVSLIVDTNTKTVDFTFKSK